nr:restriction endonuclease fold toxin [Neisseria cinerea]
MPTTASSPRTKRKASIEIANQQGKRARFWFKYASASKNIYRIKRRYCQNGIG